MSNLLRLSFPCLIWFIIGTQFLNIKIRFGKDI